MNKKRVIEKTVDTEYARAFLTNPDNPDSWLDSSEFIMLVMGYLNAKKPRNHNGIEAALDAALQNYTDGNYGKAIERLLSICKENAELLKSEIYQLIEMNKSILKSNPDKNHNRRFFETTLSQKLDKDMTSKGIYHSVNELRNIMMELGKQGLPEIKNSGIVQSPVQKPIRLQEINNYKDPADVLVQMPYFNDRIEMALKGKVSDYGRKDRLTKEKNGPIPSRNLGILKSITPNFYDEIADVDQIDRIVDRFKVDASKKEGFSGTRRDVPFVNSISGTAFTLVVLLKEYMDRNKRNPKLNTHVNNIIKVVMSTFIARGFHSLGEMSVIFNHPEVKALFDTHGVALNLNFPKEILREAAKETEKYTKEICLKKAMHNELKMRGQVLSDDGNVITKPEALKVVEKHGTLDYLDRTKKWLKRSPEKEYGQKTIETNQSKKSSNKNTGANMLNIKSSEWKQAEEYFEKKPNETKFSRKDSNRKNIRDYSFIKIEGEIYAKNTDRLARGGNAVIKIVQNKRGDNFVIRIEGAQAIDHQDEFEIMRRLKELDFMGAAERKYGKVFKLNREDLSKNEYKPTKLYSIMKYIKGKKELHDHFFLPMRYWPSRAEVKRQRRELSEEQQLIIAINSAEAFHRMHSNGIIHGDIKSANIMVDPKNYSVDAIDFGHSIILPRGKNSVVKNNEEPRGTPGYQAPETLTNSPTYSFASDIYAFGVMITNSVEGKDEFTLNLDKSFRDRILNSDPAKRPSFPEVIEYLKTKLKAVQKMEEEPMLGTTFKKKAANTEEKHLIYLAWKGDYSEFEPFLKQYPNLDLNSVNEDGGTALICAVQEGHVKIAETLLSSKGIDPNQRGANDATALHYAVGKGDINMAKLLVAKGAQPDLGDIGGVTPLDLAKGNKEMLTILKTEKQQAQPSTSAVFTHKKKAANTEEKHLIYLAWKGDYSEFEPFLKQYPNLDLNSVNEDGGTALICAVQEGHVKIAETLLSAKGIDPNQRGANDATALHYAVGKGDINMAKLLVAKGAQPDLGDIGGVTPLDLAKGNKEMITVLKAKKQQAQPSTSAVFTPQRQHTSAKKYKPELSAAAREGKLDKVKSLLKEEDTEPNQVGTGGSTPLIRAAQNGHEKVVEALLLAKGIEINKGDDNGGTALGYAVQKGYLEIVKILLEYGANPEQADKNGKIPIQMTKNQEIIDELNNPNIRAKKNSS